MYKSEKESVENCACAYAVWGRNLAKHENTGKQTKYQVDENAEMDDGKGER